MTARIGTVLAGVLRTQRRSLLLWAVAIAAVSAMYSAFYPAIGQVKFEAMMESMPPELITAMGFESMSTAAGYVSATVYALLGAVLVLVCSISLGARLVAGHEEDGLLELELSAPVARRRVYLERLLALWVTVLVLVLAVTAILLLMSASFDLELSVGNLLAASGGLLVFGGAFGTLAFAVGAVTGRRGVALGAASALAVLAYLFGYIGPLVEADWMEAVSPYHWYVGTEPLINGADWPGFGLLVVLALVPAVVGLLSFDRRDVMV